MPIAITVLGISESGFDQQRVQCSLRFSGAYPAGGDTLDFTTIAGAQIESRIFTPGDNVLFGTGEGSVGNQLSLVKGATLSTNKLKVTTTSETELGAGNYSAAMLADTNVFFEFVFPKGH